MGEIGCSDMLRVCVCGIILKRKENIHLVWTYVFILQIWREAVATTRSVWRVYKATARSLHYSDLWRRLGQTSVIPCLSRRFSVLSGAVRYILTLTVTRSDARHVSI